MDTICFNINGLEYHTRTWAMLNSSLPETIDTLSWANNSWYNDSSFIKGRFFLPKELTVDNIEHDTMVDENELNDFLSGFQIVGG